MIISCINCDKKFEVNSKLIPEDGRLLHCSSCNHEWFFEKKIAENTSVSEVKEINPSNIDFNKYLDNSPSKKKKDIILTDIVKNNEDNENLEFKNDSMNPLEIEKVKKGPGIISITLVFIISFASLVLIIDTFKYPISKIVPNVEIILYNLYETIKDIQLFFIDLI